MSEETLVDRLARLHSLQALPRAELEWIAARGRVVRYDTGEVVFRKADVVDEATIVLSGSYAILVDRGAGPRRVLGWETGDVAGLLPYSRMRSSPGDAAAEQPTELFVISREHFPAMIRECPRLTTMFVHVMLDRARTFTSSDLQDEKMMSLGRLSAGLAHELNNPASAAVRSARLLQSSLVDADAAVDALVAAALSSGQREALARVRARCVQAVRSGVLSPLERADREDALADWLDAHGVDRATAGALAEAGATPGDLEDLAATLDDATMAIALRWLAAGCTARALASEVGTAASRMYDLVGAIKRFTYMDRAAVPDRVQVGQGLRDTVTVLGAKARQKSAAVAVEVPDGLPDVVGFGGELNQVWLNLVDNALDAVGPSGRVVVSAAQDGGFVVVSVADDGPGIPEGVRQRIFDPFFTTKPVGQGTGLGLDIANRLVRKHQGEIEVDSRLGRTEFRVRLPVATDPSVMV